MLIAGLILAVLLTSTLSGVFGMVGGMILLGFLLFLLPVEAAIAAQGVIQLVANSSRAYFSREWIDWRIIRYAVLGIGAALMLLTLVEYTPNIAVVSICVGLLPVFCYIPTRWIMLDASRPPQAVLCGFLGGLLNLGVGVAGPIVDIFFARTPMDRRKIIGTKASLVLISHLAKIALYSAALSGLENRELIAISVALPFSVMGSLIGHAILSRFTNEGFRRGTVILITVVGLFYLGQGFLLLTRS